MGKRLTLLSEEHGEDEEQRKIHRRSLVDDRGSRTSTFACPGYPRSNYSPLFSYRSYSTFLFGLDRGGTDLRTIRASQYCIRLLDRRSRSRFLVSTRTLLFLLAEVCFFSLSLSSRIPDPPSSSLLPRKQSSRIVRQLTSCPTRGRSEGKDGYGVYFSGTTSSRV